MTPVIWMHRADLEDAWREVEMTVGSPGGVGLRAPGAMVRRKVFAAPHALRAVRRRRGLLAAVGVGAGACGAGLRVTANLGLPAVLYGIGLSAWMPSATFRVAIEVCSDLVARGGARTFGLGLCCRRGSQCGRRLELGGGGGWRAVRRTVAAAGGGGNGVRGRGVSLSLIR